MHHFPRGPLLAVFRSPACSETMKKSKAESSEVFEKSAVRFKGVGNRLRISLDPEVSPEVLCQELDRLLSSLNHPLDKARVFIDTGETDDKNLIGEIAAYLKKHYGVSSAGPPETITPGTKLLETQVSETQTKDTEESVRRREMDSSSWHRQHSEVLMLSGRVRSGQKVAARNHLVILGDVNPGAEVMAGGDILIIGSLLGTAIAGQPDNEAAIVLALDFRPTQVQIGSFVAAGPPSSPGKIIEFAHVEQENIVVEKYLEANPFSRLPWPVAR